MLLSRAATLSDTVNLSDYHPRDKVLSPGTTILSDTVNAVNSFGYRLKDKAFSRRTSISPDTGDAAIPFELEGNKKSQWSYRPKVFDHSYLHDPREAQRAGISYNPAPGMVDRILAKGTSGATRWRSRSDVSLQTHSSLTFRTPFRPSSKLQILKRQNTQETSKVTTGATTIPTQSVGGSLYPDVKDGLPKVSVRSPSITEPATLSADSRVALSRTSELGILETTKKMSSRLLDVVSRGGQRKRTVTHGADDGADSLSEDSDASGTKTTGNLHAQEKHAPIAVCVASCAGDAVPQAFDVSCSSIV